MRKCLGAAILILAASTMLHAQTLTGTLGQHVCGPMSPYCDGIPAVVHDGTELVNETIWVDQQTSGGFIYFTGTDPLGLQGQRPDGGYGALIVNTPYQPISRYGGSLLYNFKGSNKQGVPYTGVLTLTYTAYYSRGGGGKGGGGAGWRWLVTGGTISIQY
jgi:hypothetical protein